MRRQARFAWSRIAAGAAAFVLGCLDSGGNKPPTGNVTATPQHAADNERVIFAVRITNPPDGRPVLVTKSPFRFSVTHCATGKENVLTTSIGAEFPNARHRIAEENAASLGPGESTCFELIFRMYVFPSSVRLPGKYRALASYAWAREAGAIRGRDTTTVDLACDFFMDKGQQEIAAT